MTEIGGVKLEHKNIICLEKIPHSETFKESGFFTLIKRSSKTLITDPGTEEKIVDTNR